VRAAEGVLGGDDHDDRQQGHIYLGLAMEEPLERVLKDA
jgi:hypothetical protein